MDEQFLRDVDAGLSASPKFLLSKYFYDKRGDELFVKIMNSPEYYLTDAELDIFKNQTSELVNAIMHNGEPFELVELGAGDGTKTLELLRFLQNDYSFSYLPVDISANALHKLEKRLKTEVPNVLVKPQQGEYFTILKKIKCIDEPKTILFLGSNLGNLLDEKAHLFVTELAESMNAGDKLLLGVDLKKRIEIVLPAYNDSAGFTRDFNLNLLSRINRELGANFNIDRFNHKPIYNEEEGIAYSYLESLIPQNVHITALGKTFEFTQGERIHTEISRKYDDETIDLIFKDTGLYATRTYKDKKHLFANYLFEKR